MSAKKRLLYIDLNNRINNFRNEKMVVMFETFFREHYITDVFMHGPNAGAIHLVRKAKAANQMYDIIVTNVPLFKRRAKEPEFSRITFLSGVNYEYYAYSMSVLAGIKQLHDVPILAFTGASPDDRLSFIQTGYVDEAVESDEFPVFQKQIDRMIARYEKLPPPPEEAARIEETENGLSARVLVRLNSPIPPSIRSYFEEQCDHEQLGLLILAEDGPTPAADAPESVPPGFHLRGTCSIGGIARVRVNGKSDQSRKFIADACATLTARYIFEVPWIMDLVDRPHERPCSDMQALFGSKQPGEKHRRIQDWILFETCLAKISDELLRAKWLHFRSKFKEGDELWQFGETDCGLSGYICRLQEVYLPVILEAMKSKKLPTGFGPGFFLVRRGQIWDYVEECPISKDLVDELEELTRLHYPREYLV